MGNTKESNVLAGIALGATAKARVVKNLVMTPGADELLADLADRTDSSEGNVLRLALGMFKTALDAKEQGKHVGVTSTPEVLDVEFVGF
jgi:hypothetical protein